jgi:GTP cyclohydrolase I
VKLVAVHTCMAHRGLRTPNVPVTTVVLGGEWIAHPPSSFGS